MTEGMDIAIIGAGGFGREVLQYCWDARAVGWPHRVVGFIDDDSQALEGFDVPVSILGGFNDLGRTNVQGFIIALGAPALRRKVAEAVDAICGTLVSMIHPTAYVAPTARIGSGVILCPFTLVAANSTVGSNVAVNVYSSIGHDACIGKHCVISPYSAVTGAVDLGDECFLGTHCTIVPGITVGRCSKVAAGSTVTRNAEPGSLLAGNPAKGRPIFPVT